MPNYIHKVPKDDFGNIAEIITVYGTKLYHFIINPKTGNPKKKEKGGAKLPKKLYTQVWAIVNKDKIKKKEKMSPIENALLINELIKEIKKKSPKKSWQKCANIIFRKEAKNNYKYRDVLPIQPHFHHEREVWWYDTLKKAGITVLENGWWLVRRWKKKNGKDLEVTFQFVPDIDTLIRMCGHIIRKYRITQDENLSELDINSSINGTIEEVKNFLTSWNNKDIEQRLELQIKLASIVLKLENCHNEYKVQVKNQIEKVVPMKDSLERYNPGALAARTVAALNRLSERINEIQAILPRIAMKKELLIFEKRRQVDCFQKSASAMNLVIRHRVFHGESIRDHEIEILIKNINASMSHLNHVYGSPFFERKNQIQYCFAKAKSLIKKKKFIKAKFWLDSAKGILTEKFG